MATREQLKYYWIAEFVDGTTYKQYNEDGTENLFLHVETSPSNLKKFKIVKNDDSEEYIADFEALTITGPGVDYAVDGNNPQLIYKRRNTISYGDSTTYEVVHILGIHTDTKEQFVQIFVK